MKDTYSSFTCLYSC